MRLNLADVDLRKAALPYARLEGADLCGVHLEVADLRGAYLEARSSSAPTLSTRTSFGLSAMDTGEADVLECVSAEQGGGSSMRDVHDKMTWLNATSVAGPAVAYSLARGTPVIAWRGSENSRNITLAPVVGPPGQLAATQLEAHISEDASEHAPALYFLGDRGLVLAWVGINEARTVNVAIVDLPAGSNTVVSLQRVFVNGGGLGAGGAGPPSLSAFDPLPLSLACLNDAGQLCLASARSGLDFDAPDPVSWEAPRVEGIALSFLRAAWTRADDNRLEFISFPLTPNSRVLSAQSSLHKPSLAEFRGQLHVAWVGTDGDAHLNVAPLDAGAWNEGRDPIDPNRVETLTELSMAAPALLSLPADSSGNPERLAIFWTGVDGTGLINGAVVFP